MHAPLPCGVHATADAAANADERAQRVEHPEVEVVFEVAEAIQERFMFSIIFSPPQSCSGRGRVRGKVRDEGEARRVKVRPPGIPGKTLRAKSTSLHAPPGGVHATSDVAANADERVQRV